MDVAVFGARIKENSRVSSPIVIAITAGQLLTPCVMMIYDFIDACTMIVAVTAVTIIAASQEEP